MLDKNKLTGADISVEFCGVKLQSPFILSSGPLTYGAEGMILGHEAGCGAVVTKTIRIGRAINPVHHIGKLRGGESLINCEKWADSDRLVWYEREIPMAKKAGAVVIASVGHTLGEAKAIVEDAEKSGADMIELVSYTESDLLPMLDFTKNHVKIPVICKLSGNWPDAADVGCRCLERGADGICAIDSIGPTLKIDIETAKPEMMSEYGYGWMTGAAIRPISMRINADIMRAKPELKNLYGTGGCMCTDDAIEFLMAGCGGVGVCSVGILKGVGYIEKMCYELSTRLKELGYGSIEEVRGAALKNMRPSEVVSKLRFSYISGENAGKGETRCTKCGRCETVCSYNARRLSYPVMELDESLCRYCGLCVGICPTGALSAEVMEQTEEDLALAEESKAFYARVSELNAAAEV